jgi:hypothetical protein
MLDIPDNLNCFICPYAKVQHGQPCRFNLIPSNCISSHSVNKGAEYMVFGDDSRELLYALHNVRHISL